MALLTIDASVAVKFLVDEPGCEQARSYFPELLDAGYRSDHILTAPALMMLETHHVLAKKVRQNLVHPLVLSQAYPVLKRFVSLDDLDEECMRTARRISLFGKVRASGTAEIYPSGFSIFDIYDCVYIAHALSRGSTLVTADREHARIARDGFSLPVEFIDVASATS